MDRQETANELFERCAFLLMFDFPVRATFGIDTKSWKTGEKFRGVKMIPPGIHFIYYSVNEDSPTSLQTGFMYDFKPEEICVRYWDSESGDVKIKPMCHEELNRLYDNKQSMDSFLAPYPYEIHKQWISLTNHLTPDLVFDLCPTSGRIQSVPALLPEKSDTETRQARQRQAPPQPMDEAGDPEQPSVSSNNQSRSTNGAEGQLPHMEIDPGSLLMYTPIPRVCYPPDATAAEITKHSMDSSYKLEQVIESSLRNRTSRKGGTCTGTYKQTYKDADQSATCSNDTASEISRNGNDGNCGIIRGNSTETARYADLVILGELQLSFVCFLVGQQYESFEQWKSLVHLLCSCQESVARRESLYSSLVGVLHFQSREIPPDFFVDELARDNFLNSCFRSLFQNVDGSEASDGLKGKVRRLQRHLEAKFQWDFGSEEEDCEPVVVELQV